MRILLALALAATACRGDVADPTPTQAVCPDPDPMSLTYDSFGQRFMADYCTMCHASTLVRSQRNGAPLYHDLDTLEGTMLFAGHVDEQAGAGPAAINQRMPPDRCPSIAGGSLDSKCKQPTDEEREQLSVWLACEANRAAP